MGLEKYIGQRFYMKIMPGLSQFIEINGLCFTLGLKIRQNSSTQTLLNEKPALFIYQPLCETTLCTIGMGKASLYVLAATLELLSYSHP